MRLVTRGDLDGLTSAVIITLKEPVDQIVLIHPQDITDKKVEIRSAAILANVTYNPNAWRWFDHHLLTASNYKLPADFKWRYRVAPSSVWLDDASSTEKFPDDADL